MRKGFLAISTLLFAGAWLFPGCTQPSQKQASSIGASRSRSSQPSATEAPVPGRSSADNALTGVEKGKWVRLPLTSVDLEKKGDAQVITVKGKAPSSGWKAEIKALPVTESSTREFELVGLPSEASSGAELEAFTLTRTERFDGKVEQVLVHSADGATVVPLK